MAGGERFRLGDATLPDFYRKHGYCLLEGVRDPAECDRLIELAHRYPGRAADDFRPLMQPQRASTEFYSAIRHPRITELVELLLGGSAKGLQIQFFFGRSGTKGFACHQDNFYVEAGSDSFMSIWSALTDITPDMGTLFLYPGSHRYGRLPVRRLGGDPGPNQDPNAANEESVLPDAVQCDPVPISVRKGGVVALHGDIVHGSLTNTSGSSRYVALTTYVRSGTGFRPGRHAQRSEIDLHAVA